MRVYIDTPEGSIDIEQCAQVSELLSLKLDESDPIEQNYFLEVSSPGAERPLKKEADFEKAIGQVYLVLKRYHGLSGSRNALFSIQNPVHLLEIESARNRKYPYNQVLR